VRFLLKAGVVAAIAGAVFWYLSQDLRRDDAGPEELAAPQPVLRWFAVAVSAAVAVAIVVALVLAGSPGRARAVQLDDRRETDLAAIASAVDLYWEWHERLPTSLEELAGERRVSVPSLEDPARGEPYEYRIMGERSYELCATFEEPDREAESTPYGAAPGARFWLHEAGRQCFDVEVRVED
jgi:hypothetical protein